MNSLMSKLLDILLYPVRLFEKLTDNKAALYAGILLVGAIDLLLPDISYVMKYLFGGKPENDVYINAVLAVIIIAVLGIVDVIFVSIPLFDFFKFIKKKEGSVSGLEHEQKNGQVSSFAATPIKIMKVYIMSHFIIIPVSTIVHYVFLRNIAAESPAWMQYLALAFFMLIFIWTAAIMARGINTLFHFNPIFARLTFIVVFTWNYLFGMVFDMQIMNWLLKIFR